MQSQNRELWMGRMRRSGYIAILALLITVGWPVGQSSALGLSLITGELECTSFEAVVDIRGTKLVGGPVEFKLSEPCSTTECDDVKDAFEDVFNAHGSCGFDTFAGEEGDETSFACSGSRRDLMEIIDDLFALVEDAC